jgi:hypothetical protein
MLIPRDQEENIGGLKLRKSVLSSIPGESVSCSSETKHDRRMVPEPKLFVSKRRLQKQRSEPRKIVLGSIPSEDGFCSSVARQENSAKTKVVCFEEEIIETNATTLKTVLGSSLGEDLGFRDNFFYNIQRYVTLGMTYDMTYEATTRSPTIGVATPTQDAIFCADEPSIATPAVATPTKDTVNAY